MQRCSRHPHHVLVGVCAWCLQEKLVPLAQASSIDDDDTEGGSHEAEDEHYKQQEGDEEMQTSYITADNVEDLPSAVAPSCNNKSRLAEKYHLQRWEEKIAAAAASCVLDDGVEIPLPTAEKPPVFTYSKTTNAVGSLGPSDDIEGASLEIKKSISVHGTTPCHSTKPKKASYQNLFAAALSLKSTRNSASSTAGLPSHLANVSTAPDRDFERRTGCVHSNSISEGRKSTSSIVGIHHAFSVINPHSATANRRSGLSAFSLDIVDVSLYPSGLVFPSPSSSSLITSLFHRRRSKAKFRLGANSGSVHDADKPSANGLHLMTDNSATRGPTTRDNMLRRNRGIKQIAENSYASDQSVRKFNTAVSTARNSVADDNYCATDYSYVARQHAIKGGKADANDGCNDRSNRRFGATNWGLSWISKAMAGFHKGMS